jgi:hypothetical protein
MTLQWEMAIAPRCAIVNEASFLFILNTRQVGITIYHAHKTLDHRPVSAQHPP